jgi:hypothetical protein
LWPAVQLTETRPQSPLAIQRPYSGIVSADMAVEGGGMLAQEKAGGCGAGSGERWLPVCLVTPWGGERERADRGMGQLRPSRPYKDSREWWA